jgi:predicted DNA-binding transcriptional regulator AlpA
MAAPNADPIPRLIDRAQLLELVPLSYPMIWGKMRRGEFPRALKIDNRTLWYVDEIRAWLEKQPRQKLKGDADHDHTAMARSQGRKRKQRAASAA